MPPSTICIVFGSSGICPDMYSVSPTRIACEYAPIAARASELWITCLAMSEPPGRISSLAAQRAWDPGMDARHADGERAPANGYDCDIRGRSSAGRASRSQCEGREFDPPQLHQNLRKAASDRGCFHASPGPRDARNAHDALDDGYENHDQRDLHRRGGGDDELASLELQVAEDLDRQCRHARPG